MGYRSEVASAIYGSKNAMQEFMQEHEILVNYIQNEFSVDVKVYDVEGRTFISLYQDFVKWYDSFDEVQAWHDLLDKAQEAGLNTEFLRVGESAEGDIEQDYHGDDCKYYLEPKVGISNYLPKPKATTEPDPIAQVLGAGWGVANLGST